MKHTFTLYAPTSDSVLCHCTAWVDQPKPMTKGPDGTWTLTEELPDGTHSYRYELTSRSWFNSGKRVLIADPMARQLTPDEKSTILRIPAPGPAESYQWRNDDRPQPERERIAIYECFIQDFTRAGTFAAAGERLAGIAALGFTAVELLPLMGCDGRKSWGYTPSFFFAVEPRYGTEAELCRLIDDAHGLGMLVLFDGVYNHASQDCPLTHIDHDAYFYHDPKDPAHAWGPQFNYSFCLPGTSEFPARHFIKQKVTHWIRQFHVDGIRYDAVAQMRDDAFLFELTDWTRDVAGVKPFYSIAECIPMKDGLLGPDGAMDACWNESFSKRLRALLAGNWDGDSLEACFDCRRDAFPSGRDAVNYLGTHDSGHTVWFLREQGVDEGEAIRRMHLGFAVLLTAPGVPMGWMGDEFGAMDPPTQVPHPLPWQLAEDGPRRALRDWVGSLLALRHAHAALRGDNVAILQRDDAQRTLAVHRWDDAGGRIIVVVHAGDGDAGVTLTAPAPGAWQASGDVLVMTDGPQHELRVSLGPWQALVLVHAGVQPADRDAPAVDQHA